MPLSISRPSIILRLDHEDICLTAIASTSAPNHNKFHIGQAFYLIIADQQREFKDRWTVKSYISTYSKLSDSVMLELEHGRV